MVGLDRLAIRLGLGLRALYDLEEQRSARCPWLAIADYLLLHCWVSHSTNALQHC
jgi:hypothetical protein